MITYFWNIEWLELRVNLNSKESKTVILKKHKHKLLLQLYLSRIYFGDDRQLYWGYALDEIRIDETGFCLLFETSSFEDSYDEYKHFGLVLD